METLGKLLKRFGLHLIPVAIICAEYLSITSSLEMARSMGDYEVVPLLGGLIRVGDNLAFQDVPALLRLTHIVCLLLALVYFYLVTMRGLGRGKVQKSCEHLTIWNLDDE